MTVVIADSSPLNYLTMIGSVDVLHQLYGAVVVPQQVIDELVDPAAPHAVRAWASNLPHWIDVREPVISNDDMTHLDHGERAAILLAQSEPDALLLIDETAGRIEATREHRHTRSAAGRRAERLCGSPDRVGAPLENELPRLGGTGERSARRGRGTPPAQQIVAPAGV